MTKSQKKLRVWGETRARAGLFLFHKNNPALALVCCLLFISPHFKYKAFVPLLFLFHCCLTLFILIAFKKYKSHKVMKKEKTKPKVIKNKTLDKKLSLLQKIKGFSALSRAEKIKLVEADKRPRTTVSFYRYIPISNLVEFREKLLLKWSELDCLGRIYIAKEGINAQMNVPNENWEEFDVWTQGLPELSGVPYKIAVEEGEKSSFFKLNIKIKDKIVADGLDDKSFDVGNTGEYLTAKEMNEYINDPEAVVIDMRNAYESEIGYFEGAVKPDVDTFREELALVPELLKNEKDKKVALYCTGGIRCEKASAWLKHNGFKNVRHLKGGVIDYKHQVEREGLENKFRGKNFVFDERLGERIGDEIVSFCHLCQKNKSDQHFHCKNQICHVLFLGCDDCLEERKGYCSKKCEMMDKLPKSSKKKIAHYYNKFFRGSQFKKARLKSKV